MKLGISFVIVGTLFLGANLYGSFLLWNTGSSSVYFITGLIIPLPIIVLGIWRVNRKR